MKFIHLVPVLGVAAALGVTHALPGGTSHALAGPVSHASVVPPWLVDSEEEPAPAEKGVHAQTGLHAEHAGHAHDEHAGHAHDEHAEPVYAAHVHSDDAHDVDHRTDPHADVCAAGYGPDDPHAELCASAGAGDPHAGDPHAEDPHAGAYPPVDPASDAEDPYARVGLAPTPEVSVQAVERSGAANGHTVAEVYAARQKLAGQALRVRGTVVKLNEGILGQTYLHLRDGSGSADRGDDDLTVTTSEPFQLGETVEVSGELALDRDVGAGYVYAALLTKATRVAP